MLRAAGIAVFLLFAACRVGACAPPPPEHPRFWLAGDLNLGPNGGPERISAVSSQLHGAGIVNLEGPVGDPARGSSKERLINGPNACAALFDAGVRVAQVVNNHAMDLQSPGVEQTLLELKSAGLLASSETPVFYDAGTFTLAVQSFDLTSGVPYDFLKRLSPVRPLFLTLHVTAEPLLLPEPELEATTELALDAGVTLIAAQGTHSLAPLKWRGGALVAYGLGNLAFDCDCTDEEDGLALEVQLTPDGGLEDAWAVPVKAGLKGQPAALAADPAFTWQVLQNIGSSRLEPNGTRARVIR
ncbi:MAG: CapA family protein [Myxococcaceae bacterium]